MNLIREKSIREKSDNPTNQMINLWHDLCKEKFGKTYEVLLGNRHEHNQLKHFKGEIYLAFPGYVNNKNVLVVWVEQLNNLNVMLITHEIGHYVLYLSGFNSYTYTKIEQSNLEINLNSMAHHPALYDLQRSLGHKPQPIIDDRAKYHIEKYPKIQEPKDKDILIENALLLADDAINCNKVLNNELLKVINTNHPNTFKLIERVLDLSQYFDLLKAHRNIRFIKKVIDVLEIDKGWWNKRDQLIALKEYYAKKDCELIN